MSSDVSGPLHFLQTAPLKGYFISGKMNVYLKWVIYVVEM